jgi:DNA-binding transcriptional regulator LsrR (DeoR family)
MEVMEPRKQKLVDTTRQAMFDHKVTQVELARRMGITPTRLRHILKHGASYDKLVEMVELLGYTVNFEVKYTGD